MPLPPPVVVQAGVAQREHRVDGEPRRGHAEDPDRGRDEIAALDVSAISR